MKTEERTLEESLAIAKQGERDAINGTVDPRRQELDDDYHAGIIAGTPEPPAHFEQWWNDSY